MCRKEVSKKEVVGVPTESRFAVDIHGQGFEDSSKVRVLMQHLEEIRERQEKSVVFSQWTAFLDLVEVPMNR